MNKPYRSSESWTRSGGFPPLPSLQEILSKIWGPVRSVGGTTFSFFTLDSPRTIAAHSDDGQLIANLIIRPDGQMEVIFHTNDPALESAAVRFDVRIIDPHVIDPVPLTEGMVKLSPREGRHPIVSPRGLKRGDILLVRFAVLDQ